MLVVTPESVFGMLVSAQALILALFGGVGSLWGPVIGAAVLVPLAEGLNAELGAVLPGIQGVVYGVAIIAIILLAPEGVYWRVRDRLSRTAGADRGAARRRLGAGARRNPRSLAPLPRPVTQGRDLLVLRDIGISFGGLRALDGIDLVVPEGGLYGIIGPNGAGKTTLFNVINGFLTPDRGTISFAGEPITGLRPNRVCRRGIGRTFQVVRAFSRMTVLENVIVGAFVGARDDATARRMALAALDRVGLAAAAEALAGGLTTRELRLMELARALVPRPKLMLLDETLAGPRPRGSRRHSRRDPAVARRRHDGADHRAHDAGDGAAGRSFRCARPWKADRLGAARRRRARPERHRGLSRQEMGRSRRGSGQITV